MVKKITAAAVLIMIVSFFVVMYGEVSTDIWVEWENIKQSFLGGV